MGKVIPLYFPLGVEFSGPVISSDHKMYNMHILKNCKNSLQNLSKRIIDKKVNP